MIVADTSALIGLVRNESEAARCRAALADAMSRHVSAASVIEASIVLESRFGAAAVAELDVLIQSMNIEIVSVDPTQIAFARQAHRLYGKGRHRAALNFGDCFSYALARALGAPLLFVGTDFARTDIGVA